VLGTRGMNAGTLKGTGCLEDLGPHGVCEYIYMYIYTYMNIYIYIF
jgi:hypothetical protein